MISPLAGRDMGNAENTLLSLFMLGLGLYISVYCHSAVICM